MKYFCIAGLALTLSACAWAKLDEGERLNRLSIIANSLPNRNLDGVALMTEAVNLCGFTVKPDSFFLAPKPTEPPKSTDEPNLHLYISTSEIKEYVQLYRNSQMVNLSDLCGSIDKLSASIGLTASCKPDVTHWLQTGMFDKDPGKKALTTFIRDLASTHSSISDMSISDATMLDALQSFLIMRVMTEEIEVPLRKRLSKQLYASTSPAIDLLPEGFASSDFFKGVAEYLPKVEAWIEGLEEGKLTGQLAKLNPILAVVKVVASYACLKGDMDMEAPGAPLIRTKSSSPDDAGEKRTITAHFYYDKEKVTDFLNDNAAYFKALGIEPEMPKGDLSGVETAWDFRTPVLATQQTFRTVNGQGDVSKVMTDDAGVAKVTIEGTPQFQVISSDYATPLDKQYMVYVTPQLVKPDANGGISWAFAGVSAVKDGGSGAFGVLTDFVAGMKVKTGTKYSLVVRDWTNAKAVVDLSLEFSASGDINATHQSLFHFVSIENAIASELPSQPMPKGLTPEQLQYIPEAERAKVQAELAKVTASNPYTTFVPDMNKGTVVHWGVMDSENGGVVEQTWNGGGDKKLDPRAKPDSVIAGFQVSIDPAKKVALLLAAGEGDVTMTKHTVGSDSKDDQKSQVRWGTGSWISRDSMSSPKGDLMVPITITGEGASTVYSCDTMVNFKMSSGIVGTLRIHLRLRKAGSK